MRKILPLLALFLVTACAPVDHVARVDGAVVMEDGSTRRLDQGVLLEPLEHALRALSWSMVGLALALVGARLV